MVINYICIKIFKMYLRLEYKIIWDTVYFGSARSKVYV